MSTVSQVAAVVHAHNCQGAIRKILLVNNRLNVANSLKNGLFSSWDGVSLRDTCSLFFIHPQFDHFSSFGAAQVAKQLISINMANSDLCVFILYILLFPRSCWSHDCWAALYIRRKRFSVSSSVYTCNRRVVKERKRGACFQLDKLGTCIKVAISNNLPNIQTHHTHACGVLWQFSQPENEKRHLPKSSKKPT